MPDFSNMLFSPQYAGIGVTLDLMSVMLVTTLSEGVSHVIQKKHDKRESIQLFTFIFCFMYL